MSPGPPAVVNLSLVSHTNVGKTTLARTLLRRDVGEVRDEAHVTETAEGHVLIDTPGGETLRLWDTPGFGDSARLGKRLRMSNNPIGWLLTQVWDRLTDRPFYSSQQAIRNVKDESDVVLYLVNAAEAPASAGYVEAEMQILGWTGKPVVLLLNQMGPPRGHDSDAADEAAWRQHLAPYPWVRAAVSLDAFARCWVQEDGLLGVVGAVLPPEKTGDLRAPARRMAGPQPPGVRGVHAGHHRADRRRRNRPRAGRRARARGAGRPLARVSPAREPRSRTREPSRP